MVTKVKEVKDKVQNGATANPIFESVRKVLLASVGAVSLAQSEVEELVNKLIERGEIKEKDGRKLIDELREKQRKQAKKAEKELDKRLDDILARLNIPTRSDIDALNKKIAELTKKIDELKKAA